MPQYLEHQNAFNAGELAPTMLGRSDIAAYAAGLRLAQNFIILRPGGAERRPGSIYLAELEAGITSARLLRFRFSETEAYILEFTETGMRVYKHVGGVGTQIAYGTLTFQAPIAVDTATEEILASVAHGWPSGLTVNATAIGTGVLPTGMAAATDYTVQKPLTYTVDQSTGIDDISDEINIGTHDLVVNMGPFWVSTTNVIPPGLDYETDYYVESVTGDEITLSLTAGGAAVDITGAGSGFLTLRPTAEYARTKFRLRNVGGAIIDLSATGSGSFALGPPSAVPYKLSDDWTYQSSDLFLIQSTQDKDALYLAREGFALRRIIRYNDSAWEIDSAPLEDGPYLDLAYYYPDQDEAGTTLAPAATTGNNVTVTASKALFRGSDVGRSIRIGDDEQPQRWGWGKIVEVGGVYWDDLDIISFAMSDINWPQDIVEFSGHTFLNGEGPVRVDASVYGLSTGTDYYLHTVTGYWVSFHTSYADALTGDNPVDITLFPFGPFSATSSRIYVPSHGLTDGEGPLTLGTTGILPSNYSESTEYYANSIDSDHVSLALTIGGPGVAADFPNGSGVHTILGQTGPVATCKANINSEFPAAAPQESWRLGAFGAAEKLGYPVAVTLHEQRLALSGASGTPQTLYASRTGLQLLFSPDNTDADPVAHATDRLLLATSGYTFKLVSEDLNAINWIRPVRALLCGGLGGIFYVTGATFSESISPTNVNAKRGTTTGSTAPSPMVLGSSVIFVDESGGMVSRAQLEPSSEAIEVDELMAMASHLSQDRTIVQLAASETPLPVVWAVDDNGTLLSLTFDPKQNVAAWARHILGGTDAKVESVATLPDAQGGQVYLVVSRTIGGVTKRFVEYLAPRLTENADDQLHHGLDCSPLAYDGTSTDTLTGLDHLEGETINVVADGGATPQQVVSGGQVTLDFEFTKAVAGFNFDGILHLLPVEIPQATGQAVANRIVRAITASIRLNRTRSLKVGPALDQLTDVNFRHINDPMDAPPPLFTGVKEIALELGYDRDGSYYIVSDQGMPCQILSTLTRLEFGER